MSYKGDQYVPRFLHKALKWNDGDPLEEFAQAEEMKGDVLLGLPQLTKEEKVARKRKRELKDEGAKPLKKSKEFVSELTCRRRTSWTDLG